MIEKKTQLPPEDNIDFGRLLAVLIDHKLLIMVITVLFAAGGAAYAKLQTPIYRGDALVQVERRSTVSPLGDLGNVLGGAADLEINTSAEVQILQSRMVLGQAIDRIGKDTIIEPMKLPLIGEYIVRNGITRPEFPINLPYVSDYVLSSGIPQPDFLEELPYIWGGESIEVARFELAKHRRELQVTVQSISNERYRVIIDGQTIGEGKIGNVGTFLGGELHLRIEAINAPPGAQFHLHKQNRDSAVRSLGSRLQIEEVGGKGTSTGVLRLSLVGPDTQEIVDTLDAVAETFLTQNVERQSAKADQSLAFLEEQAPELRSQLNEAEERLNEYRLQLDSIDLSSEAQSTIQRYIEIDSHLNELEFQEAEIAQRYTPSHPTYQALLRKKRHLSDERAELNERVNELPAAQQEIIRRTRDVEVTQAIYVNVLNKIQELEVAKAGTIGNVRIIDNAQIAGIVSPQKSRIILLATLLGAFLAVGGVLLRALLRRGVDSADQIEAVGLPVYATIPQSVSQLKLIKRNRRYPLRNGKPIINSILAMTIPTDTAVEALRGLRTSLHFAMLKGCNEHNNRLMITGPAPGVGKSFVCLNLAAVSAQAGLKVLLIDADMRKGNMHHAFHRHSGKGLAEYLSGQMSLGDTIQGTGVDNLHFISRGTVPPNPSELLMQPLLSTALEGLSGQYDLVIIDTPPVLAVTDASVIGKYCDTSLLVVRFESNPVHEIMAAKVRMEGAGLKVQGAVLNAIVRKSSSFSRYYGYYPYTYK